MIRLDVQPYCHECDAFEPVKVDGGKAYEYETIVVIDCFIRCRYAKRCAALVRYLERQTKQEELKRGILEIIQSERTNE